jgi:flagellar hook protein FlgE
MFTSFSTALSALNATATAVDVVGNNLANLNTPGFKTNVVYFRDLVTQSPASARPRSVSVPAAR